MNPARAEIVDWLWAWFKNRDASSVKFRTEGEVRYLDLGLIDSMGLMELIGAIEEKHGVRFDERHFQDPRFLTMGGLAELVAELRKKE